MGDKNVAIITARGGSKRIPKKNIKDFCGKPIIAYSIQAALESNLFEEVMVSTDSEEIAEIAKSYGAKVPFMRSEKTSNDFAGTADVLMEVLGKYAELGEQFQYMCCLYPTAPFVTPEKLVKAMNMLKEKRAKVVMTVVPFSYPPQRCFVIDEDSNMKYKFEQYKLSRSQDLEKFYHDAGQFYFYDAKKFVDLQGKIYSEICPVVVSELEVQDIDDFTDWKIAEMKYQLMVENMSGNDL